MKDKIATAILGGLVILGLVACVSPAEMRAEDEAACAGYGFPRGTVDFASCLQRENLARRYGPWVGPPPFGFGWYDSHMSPPRVPADVR